MGRRSPLLARHRADPAAALSGAVLLTAALLLPAAASVASTPSLQVHGSSEFAGYRFGVKRGSLVSESARLVVPRLACSRSKRMRDNYYVEFGLGMATGNPTSLSGTGASLDVTCTWSAKAKRWNYAYEAVVGASGPSGGPPAPALRTHPGDELLFSVGDHGGTVDARVLDETTHHAVAQRATDVGDLAKGEIGANDLMSVLLGPGLGSCGPSTTPSGWCPIPPSPLRSSALPQSTAARSRGRLALVATSSSTCLARRTSPRARSVGAAVSSAASSATAESLHAHARRHLERAGRLQRFSKRGGRRAQDTLR